MKSLLVGGLAGLAGAAGMRLVVKQWERLYPGEPQHGPFGLDREADRNAAILFWNRVSSTPLTTLDAERIGAAFHYALGAGAGVGYSLLPASLRRDRGLAYSLLIWLLGDLLAVSVSGTSDPRTKTLDSHAVALAAHLLYGVTTDAILRRFAL